MLIGGQFTLQQYEGQRHGDTGYGNAGKEAIIQSEHVCPHILDVHILLPVLPTTIRTRYITPMHLRGQN